MNRREQAGEASRWARSVLDRSATDASGGPGPQGWQASWQALELPHQSNAPTVPTAPAVSIPALAAPGFARRVAGAWAAEQAAATAPILGAAWMRAAALAALLAGIALGTTLADGSASSGLAGSDASDANDDSWQTPSLSEAYLSALASPEATLASPTDAP